MRNGVIAGLRRAGYAILVIVLVTFGVSLLLSLTPGSVAQVVLGEEATPEAVAELNRSLGLDRPLLVQYGDWVWHALQGDLGTSPVTKRPVTQSILERVPVTLEIAVLGLTIALVVAIILAVLSANKPNGPLDRTINAFTSVLLSVPTFVAAPILIFVFAIVFRSLPALGWTPLSEGLIPNLRSALLPALAAGLVEIAAFHRVLRGDLVGTLREDFVAAARAKGMGRAYVMFRHAFRPSSFSLLTVSGLSLARLIGGTVIVETLFVLPGIGQFIAQSIAQRDVIAVQGAVAFIAIVFVLVNALVDIGYGLVDPRVRRAPRVRKAARGPQTPAKQKVAA